MLENHIAIPFDLKDVGEDGVFKGYGAVFGNVDSYREVIRPGAFIKTLKRGGRNGYGVAMLLQHGRTDNTPIGVWTDLQEDKKGLKVEGQLAMEVQRARETHSLLKLKALRGLSIGYDFPRDKNGKIKKGAIERDEEKNITYLNQIELWEISPVTFPANTRATITGVKEIGIENATTIKELEAILRDSGYSKSKALTMIAQLRQLFLRDSKKEEEMKLILQGLESIT